MDTVASATAINSVNKGTHRAKGRVKKRISSTGGRPPDVRGCECGATARTSFRVRPKGSSTCEGSSSSRDRVLRDSGGPVDAAAAVTMSGKKAAEKVSEIDAHISKQYDIVRRLGKGVITLSTPVRPRAKNFAGDARARRFANLPSSP